jgi:hypothetical protein
LAFAGPSAVGNDLGGLLGNSLYFFDYNPWDAEILNADLGDGSIAGIVEHRAELDPHIVRLGYLISLSFFMEYLIG